MSSSIVYGGNYLANTSKISGAVIETIIILILIMIILILIIVRVVLLVAYLW